MHRSTTATLLEDQPQCDVYFLISIEILIVTLQVEIVGRNTDQLRSRFRQQSHRGFLLILEIMYRAVKIAEIQSKNDIGVGHSAAAGKMMAIGHGASATVHGNLQRFSQLDHQL